MQVKDIKCLASVLTVPEAAEQYGYNKKTINRLCRFGGLIARQTKSGAWLILRSSAEERLTNGRLS